MSDKPIYVNDVFVCKLTAIRHLQGKKFGITIEDKILLEILLKTVICDAIMIDKSMKQRYLIPDPNAYVWDFANPVRLFEICHFIDNRTCIILAQRARYLTPIFIYCSVQLLRSSIRPSLVSLVSQSILHWDVRKEQFFPVSHGINTVEYIEVEQRPELQHQNIILQQQTGIAKGVIKRLPYFTSKLCNFTTCIEKIDDCLIVQRDNKIIFVSVFDTSLQKYYVSAEQFTLLRKLLRFEPKRVSNQYFKDIYPTIDRHISSKLLQANYEIGRGPLDWPILTWKIPPNLQNRHKKNQFLMTKLPAVVFCSAFFSTFGNRYVLCSTHDFCTISTLRLLLVPLRHLDLKNVSQKIPNAQIEEDMAIIPFPFVRCNVNLTQNNYCNAYYIDNVLLSPA